MPLSFEGKWCKVEYIDQLNKFLGIEIYLIFKKKILKKRTYFTTTGGVKHDLEVGVWRMACATQITTQPRYMTVAWFP